MPPRSPQPPPARDDNDAARRAAKGQVETIPGFPRRHLPPVKPRPLLEIEEPTRPDAPLALRPAPELDTEPPPSILAQEPLHAPHGRSGRTLTGVAPPPKPLPPVSVAPPRSITPVPVSLPEEVLLSNKGVRLRLTWAQVRSWLIVFGVFGVGGGIAGWFGGLKLAAAEVAELKASIAETKRDHGKRLVTLEEQTKRHEARIDEQSNALAAESQSNRTERATRDRLIRELRDDLEAATPRIHGIPAKPK